MPPCTVDLEVGAKQILLRTGFGDFRFEVWQGGIDREVWDLLKSLELPGLRDNAHREWTVTMPEPFSASNPNQGEERRFVVFTAPDRGRLVLRCSQGAYPVPVSQPLYRMLKQLDYRKEQHHEEDRRGQGDAAAAGGALEGGRGGDGPNPAAGLDGPAEQEGRRQVEDPELRRAIGQNPLMRTPSQEEYLEKLRAARAAGKNRPAALQPVGRRRGKSRKRHLQ